MPLFDHHVPVTKTTFTSHYDYTYIPEPGGLLTENPNADKTGHLSNHPMYTGTRRQEDGYVSTNRDHFDGRRDLPTGVKSVTAHCREGGVLPIGGPIGLSTMKDHYTRNALAGAGGAPPRSAATGLARQYDPDFLAHPSKDSPTKARPVMDIPHRPTMSHRGGLHTAPGPFGNPQPTSKTYGVRPDQNGTGEPSIPAAVLAAEWRKGKGVPRDLPPDMYNPIKMGKLDMPRCGVSRRHDLEGHVFQSTAHASYVNMGNMPELRGDKEVPKDHVFQHKDLVDFRPLQALEQATQMDGTLAASKPDGVHDATWDILKRQTSKALQEDPHVHKQRLPELGGTTTRLRGTGSVKPMVTANMISTGQGIRLV